MPDYANLCPVHVRALTHWREEHRHESDEDHVDLVAEAICPRITGSCEFCKSAARRIIAFPEEVLSGLVRVGVATREWRGDEYRYVTPWKETP